MRQNLGNFYLLLQAFIFFGCIGCSMGTDKSTSMPEKSLNQLGLSTERPLLKSGNKTSSAKAILTEGSGIKASGHPEVDDNKVFPRRIVVPPEVKNKWRAVKILIQNKLDEERGGLQVVELGTSVTPKDSELKVIVGPFLPNFMMDKMVYTSIGNGELNPAVQLVVEENGKIIYKGWAFKNFPSMYAFEHQLFSIKLLGAIPADVS